MKNLPANFLAIFAIIFAATLLAGCSSTTTASGAPRGQNPPAQPPAMIGHIVIIQLHDSSDYFELLNDADWMLGTIPSVATYAAGKHLDTGRSTVTANYDLAIYLGFNSEQDLQSYVADDQRIRFVQKWEPRLNSLVVYDMIDWPTTRYGIRN